MRLLRVHGLFRPSGTPPQIKSLTAVIIITPLSARSCPLESNDWTAPIMNFSARVQNSKVIEMIIVIIEFDYKRWTVLQ